MLMNECNWLNVAFHYDRCNDHAKEDVLPACQTTLKNLQIEYLDLYLVLHDFLTF